MHRSKPPFLSHFGWFTAALFLLSVNGSTLTGEALFRESFAFPPTDDFSTLSEGKDRGWAATPAQNVRIPETPRNSPWDLDEGSNSVRIYHDGGRSAALYLSLAGALPGAEALTAENQPEDLAFRWDFRTTTVGGDNRNRAQFLIGSGTVSSLRNDPAIRVYVSRGHGSFSYRDGPEIQSTGDGTFQQNTWYRFEVFAVDISGGTYGLRIFREDTYPAPMYERSEIRFANPVNVLEAIRFNHIYANTDNRWYNIDNVTIEVSR